MKRQLRTRRTIPTTTLRARLSLNPLQYNHRTIRHRRSTVLCNTPPRCPPRPQERRFSMPGARPRRCTRSLAIHIPAPPPAQQCTLRSRCRAFLPHTPRSIPDRFLTKYNSSSSSRGRISLFQVTSPRLLDMVRHPDRATRPTPAKVLIRPRCPSSFLLLKAFHPPAAARSRELPLARRRRHFHDLPHNPLGRPRQDTIRITHQYRPCPGARRMVRARRREKLRRRHCSRRRRLASKLNRAAMIPCQGNIQGMPGAKGKGASA